MQLPSQSNRASTKLDAVDNRRLGTPNRPLAISRFVFNTFKEALLHPTVTSTFDMRTGRVIARDGKRLSN